jgi:hypothetical protein
MPTPTTNTLHRLRCLRQQVGFRGATLLWFATVDFAYGFSLAVPAERALQSPTIRWVGSLIPLELWAAWWLATGVLCVVFAFRRHDRIGFGFEAALKGVTGMVMAAGWALGIVPRGWVSAAIWLVMAGWVTLVANWPEPVPEG